MKYINSEKTIRVCINPTDIEEPLASDGGVTF